MLRTILASICAMLMSFGVIAQSAPDFTKIDPQEIETVVQLAHKDSVTRSFYADVLNFDVNAQTNLKLMGFINDWFGTPYRWGGNSKNGIDCSRFVNRVYGAVYNENLGWRTARGIFRELTEAISINDLKEGDLVFFKVGKRYISHIGIYLGNNKFVHSSSSNGVAISDLDEPYWQHYFYKAGRIIRSYLQ